MYNMLLTTAHVLYKGREMTFETVQQLFLPPSCGALVLIAVKLPLILWLIPYKKERQKNMHQWKFTVRSGFLRPKIQNFQIMTDNIS